MWRAEDEERERRYAYEDEERERRQDEEWKRRQDESDARWRQAHATAEAEANRIMEAREVDQAYDLAVARKNRLSRELDDMLTRVAAEQEERRLTLAKLKSERDAASVGPTTEAAAKRCGISENSAVREVKRGRHYWR